MTPKKKKAEDEESTWKGLRPWIGGVSILALMAFEYWFISNGFMEPCPPKEQCDPNLVGWDWPISILVPMAGVMAFFGVLFIANIFSKSSDLSSGEMRKAITGGIVVTYIFFIMTILFSPSSPIYKLSPLPQTDPADDAASAPSETAIPELTATPQSDAGLYVVRQEITATPNIITIATDTPVPTFTATATGVVPEPEADSAEPPADDADEPAAQEASIETPIQLAASVIKAFTTLVGVVVGFYFSTRSIDNYNKLQALIAKPELRDTLDEED
jgi:hypothetical protein